MTTDALPPVAAAAAAAAAAGAAVVAPPRPPAQAASHKRPAPARQPAGHPPPPRSRRKPPPADVQFRLAVHAAAKAQDVDAALAAYDGAVARGLAIPAETANTVLYLCAGGDEWDAGLDVLGAPPAWKRRAAFSGGGEAAPPPLAPSASPPDALAARGREVFARLLNPPPPADPESPPNPPLRARDGEMAWTSAARMAARAGDAAGALAAARGAVAAGLPPRLRTWAPALMAYAAAGDAAAALAVDEEAAGHGLTAGEVELAVLAGAAAKASASPGGGAAPALPPGALASVLTRLGREHAALQPESVDALEALFKSPAARELLAAGGGCGAAPTTAPAPAAWSLSWVTPDAATGAVPPSAGGGLLAPADLEADEWEAFAGGVAALARERARRPADFDAFTAWLDAHGPFDAVVDGANVALYGQNWEHGGFDWGQLGAVLDALARERGVQVAGPRPAAGGCRGGEGGGGEGGEPSPAAATTAAAADDDAAAAAAHPPRALVILHRSRTGGPGAAAPLARRLLGALASASCLYTAPHGSNDDWFWLYAAVAARGRGLLVSNDEMRDHVFQLLSPRFFARWKGRHQVRYEVGPTSGGGGGSAAAGGAASGGAWGAGRYASLSFPPPYSVCAQRLPESGTWLVPAVEPPTPGAWLCARPV